MYSIQNLNLLFSSLPKFATSYSAFQSWLPVAVIALVLSALFISIYYMIGALLGNARVKKTALNEFGQIVGTAIIVVLVLSIIPNFNNLFINSIVPSSNIVSLCSSSDPNALSHSQIDLLNSQTQNINGFPSAPTYSLCGLVEAYSSPSSQVDITPSVDYGLASTYIITAYLANQAINNLNYLFRYSNYIGFLSTFTIRNTACFPDTCYADPKLGLDIIYSYTPYAGYSMIIKGITPLFSLANFLFELYIVQIVFILILIYAWPYLLAGGIILRATLFGKKTGGLLIAIAIVAVLIFPGIYLSEYSALHLNLQHLSPSGINNAALGNNAPYNYASFIASSYPGMQLVENTPILTNYFGTPVANPSAPGADYIEPNTNAPSQQYQFDPYEFPFIAGVLSADNCWTNNLLTTESVVSIPHMIPVVSQINAIVDVGFGFFGFVPNPFLDLYQTNLLGAKLSALSLAVPEIGNIINLAFNNYNACTPTYALKSFFDLVKVYAIMYVSGVILPIFNLLLSIAAVQGISYLMGGDTNIVGIGKII